MVDIPKVLPVSPISLVCPFCKAKPGEDCIKLSDGIAVLHIQRIQAAAAQDKANKRNPREDVNQAAARVVKEATERD
jgi:hypothetical protein